MVGSFSSTGKPPSWRCATCMPETLCILGRIRKHEQHSRDAVPGSEGPGGAAPCGARLPPLARGGAEDCESHGEHHSISPRVKPGRAIRRPRDGESGRAEKTPKRLNGLNRPGRRGPGQVAPGRGHGGLYHARLASFPIHMGALLTHRGRCSETGLGKFLEIFWVKICGCWCERLVMMGDFSPRRCEGRKVFLSFDLASRLRERPGAGEDGGRGIHREDAKAAK